MRASDFAESAKTSPPLAVRLRRAGAISVAFGAMGLLLFANGVPCAFAGLFHTPCPGCGSTRAVLALLHGDLAGVLRHNPIGPVVAVLAATLAVQAVRSVLVHGDSRAMGEGRVGYVVKRGIILCFGLEIVLWVARFFGAFGGPVPV
ncbi:MAG TPA: DUF2752 domain-containing protein [Labilithrix sp.]|nr:DUF2752 domain-containing protein [Labilithrix sp.]